MTSFASHRLARSAGILTTILVLGVVGCGEKSKHALGAVHGWGPLCQVAIADANVVPLRRIGFQPVLACADRLETYPTRS